MRIKWLNVLVLALVIAAAVLIIRTGPELLDRLSLITDRGPRRSWEDRHTALLALAMVLIAVVALARILSEHRRQR